MAILIQQYVLLISFSLIYLVFLFYDLFRRGDNYGSFAYIAALLPANYLWYVLSTNSVEDPSLLNFGPMGAMMVLAILWLLAVIRDIIIKDRENGIKDADDVALMLVVSIILNLILAAVLPALPALANMKLGTSPWLKFFYTPFNASQPASDGVILAYKIIVSLLTLSVIVPVILDLKDMQTNMVALVIVTIIFGIPFAFLAFLWAPALDLIWVFLFLFLVIFFIFLLMLTRGNSR